MAQAPGAVRVIKGTIATPASTAGRRPPGRRCRTACPTCRSRACYFDPRDATRQHDLRGDARRHLQDDRRRRELGAVRQRTSDRARQRHLHAAGRQLRPHRHVRPRHLGARAARAGERRARGRRRLVRLRRRAGQRRDRRADGHADEPGAEQRQPRDADGDVDEPERDVPEGQRALVPARAEERPSTGSIRVAVNGAAGIEAADFQIAIESPELGLPPSSTSSPHTA